MAQEQGARMAVEIGDKSVVLWFLTCAMSFHWPEALEKRYRACRSSLLCLVSGGGTLRSAQIRLRFRTESLLKMPGECAGESGILGFGPGRGLGVAPLNPGFPHHRSKRALLHPSAMGPESSGASRVKKNALLRRLLH